MQAPIPYIVVKNYIGATHHQLVAKKDDILQVCGYLNPLTGVPLGHAKNMRTESAGSIPMSHLRRLSDEERESRGLWPWNSHIETLSFDSATLYAATAAAHVAAAATPPRGLGSSPVVIVNADGTVQVGSGPSKSANTSECYGLWGSLEWKAGDHLRIYYQKAPDPILRELERLTGNDDSAHRLDQKKNRDEDRRPCCDGQMRPGPEGDAPKTPDAGEEEEEEGPVGYFFGYNLRTRQFGYCNLFALQSFCAHDDI